MKIPSFYGIFEVKNASKGRLRLSINKLINNKEEMNFFKEQLITIKGINEVKCNNTFGEVIISYDEEKIETQMLVGVILRMLELEEEVFSNKDGSLRKTFNEFLEIVDLTVYNKTKGFLDLEMLLSSSFIFLGLKNMFVNPRMTNGATLLWWAYSLTTRRKR